MKKRETIASDGGLKGRQGTFGWNLSTDKKKQSLFERAGPVDGPYDTANSTRCEVGGYVASLLLLSLLSTIRGTKVRCKLRWLTDRKSAITRVKEITDVGHRPTKPPKKLLIFFNRSKHILQRSGNRSARLGSKAIKQLLEIPHPKRTSTSSEITMRTSWQPGIETNVHSHSQRNQQTISLKPKSQFC
jgi:hypothetical protein